MARSKDELLKQAQASGLVAEDVSADDYTAEELQALLRGDVPAWKGSRSSSEPLKAPDGHVTLSKEDIEARG
jgi:hypothetical protein